jgi:hypothetical protein
VVICAKPRGYGRADHRAPRGSAVEGEKRLRHCLAANAGTVGPTETCEIDDVPNSSETAALPQSISAPGLAAAASEVEYDRNAGRTLSALPVGHNPGLSVSP